MRFIRTAVALLAFAVLATAPASAQTTRLGAKVGLTSSTLTGDDVQDAESLTGISAGAFLTYQINPAFAIQPEVLYVSRGASGAFEEEDINADLQLRYVQIPVLAKFSFGTGPLRPSIFAGPAIAFNTSCKVKIEAPGIEATVDCDEGDITDEDPVKSTDFGAVAGVGFDYDFGAASLVIDARLDLGLSNIDDTGEEADVKNRAWSFMAGLSFPIGAR